MDLKSLLPIYRDYDHSARKPECPAREWFFQQIAERIWGPNNKTFRFCWHPWADKANWVCHAYQYPSLNGCASSGKTMYLALYALINWLCSPMNTLVLVTSTDLKASRKRIWGSIVQLWLAAPGLPGKLVDSQGIIVTLDQRGNKMTDKSGVALVAGEKKKEKEALGKLIGAKNKRVILIADELPELSEAILETALGNLTSNPYFQMIASGNFRSRYDPFGTFSEPKGGYDSIDVNTLEWETKLGYCVRFDGMQSPNITEGRSGKDEYPGIYGSKQLREHRQNLGENSASFWRMCRSYEPGIGLDNVIYSESDFIAGSAYEGAIWLGEPQAVSGMDPSFTNGGDRCVQWIAHWGHTVHGFQALLLHKALLLREDATKKNETRNFQIARQFIANCEQYRVKPRLAGMDTTGAGAVLYDIVCELWKDAEGQSLGAQVLKVDFSGAATELPVRANDDKTAHQSYDRKVTELWYVGLEFVRGRQIRGVTPELARELKARQYDTVKGADGLKIRVESKKDMKERLGFSPDLGDGFAVTLHVCRERLGAVAGSATVGLAAVSELWKKQHEAAKRVYYEENLYQPEAV